MKKIFLSLLIAIACSVSASAQDNGKEGGGYDASAFYGDTSSGDVTYKRTKLGFSVGGGASVFETKNDLEMRSPGYTVGGAFIITTGLCRSQTPRWTAEFGVGIYVSGTGADYYNNSGSSYYSRMEEVTTTYLDIANLSARIRLNFNPRSRKAIWYMYLGAQISPCAFGPGMEKEGYSGGTKVYSYESSNYNFGGHLNFGFGVAGRHVGFQFGFQHSRWTTSPVFNTIGGNLFFVW